MAHNCPFFCSLSHSPSILLKNSLDHWNCNFSSNLVECVDFSDLSGFTVGWFIIFSELITQSLNVRLSGAENITGHDEMAPLSLTSRQIYFVAQWPPSYTTRQIYFVAQRPPSTQLGGFTLWHNRRRATQLCKFTLWHNGRRAKSTRFDACTRRRTHFPKTVTNHAEKYEGSIQSKILLRVFDFSKLLKDERFGRFSKHRSIVDLQQTLEICTLYEDSANF